MRKLLPNRQVSVFQILLIPRNFPHTTGCRVFYRTAEKIPMQIKCRLVIRQTDDNPWAQPPTCHGFWLVVCGMFSYCTMGSLLIVWVLMLTLLGGGTVDSWYESIANRYKAKVMHSCHKTRTRILQECFGRRKNWGCTDLRFRSVQRKKSRVVTHAEKCFGKRRKGF